MKKLFLLQISIIFLTNILNAQYTNIQIATQYQPHETSIMINPFNPNIIVAGANVYAGNSLSGYYYSSNGGLNWNGSVLTSNVSTPSGDPK